MVEVEVDVLVKSFFDITLLSLLELKTKRDRFSSIDG